MQRGIARPIISPMAEALERQEPFVNPTLANHALSLLGRTFRYGSISHHGGFVSLSSLAEVQALRVDPKYWKRLRKRDGRIKALKPDATMLVKPLPQTA